MAEDAPPEFGKPGEPGWVEVIHLRDLANQVPIEFSVGTPGKPGQGGQAEIPGDLPQGIIEVQDLLNPGGAGGGRENAPIIEALKLYAESLVGAYLKPLCFLEPGHYEFPWPYDTPTATMVRIGPGGGGGGGGATVTEQGGRLLVRHGAEGEEGLPGAVFIFPTEVPTQDASTRIL